MPTIDSIQQILGASFDLDIEDLIALESPEDDEKFATPFRNWLHSIVMNAERSPSGNPRFVRLILLACHVTAKERRTRIP